MMVIFSFILAFALLTGIIFALRHHQERTRQALIAREQPLPPLPKRDAALSRPAAPAQTQATDHSPPLADTPAEPGATTPREPSLDTTADWRQTCQKLRDQGRFEDALTICQQAWPQWQSFDHAARVMRAAIRSSGSGTADRQHWLSRLYTLACQASFLHDKVDGLPDPTRQLLVQTFTLQDVAGLDMPWSHIGYQNLRLLTKSDCKQLLQWKGEPQTHQSARIFHAKQWLTSIS